MKKNLWAVMAVALAVGISAFTTKKQQKPDSQIPTYYWYYYDNSTDQLTGELVSPNPLLTRAIAIGVTGCNGTTTPECARGYSTEYTSFPVNNPPAGEDAIRIHP